MTATVPAWGAARFSVTAVDVFFGNPSDEQSRSLRDDFNGFYVSIEDPDTKYLRRNGWDEDAPIYKCFTAMLTGSTSGYEARSDSAAARLSEVGQFAGDLNRASGQSLIDFLNERVHVDALFDYRSVQAIITDMDSVSKNWLSSDAVVIPRYCQRKVEMSAFLPGRTVRFLQG